MTICAQKIVSLRLNIDRGDKHGATSLPAILCDKAPAPRMIVHGYELIFLLKTVQTTMSQCWYETTTNSYSSSLPKEHLTVCFLKTTQFSALALLFWLWGVHKYWLSCQIIRIINVNPLVDLASVLFSSIWHSWKFTSFHTSRHEVICQLAGQALWAMQWACFIFNAISHQLSDWN